MENNTAQHPVNQQIVVGEPVVSKNHGARQIEQSYIKVNETGIHKAVSGTGVNECRNTERRVRNKQRG